MPPQLVTSLEMGQCLLLQRSFSFMLPCLCRLLLLGMTLLPLSYHLFTYLPPITQLFPGYHHVCLVHCCDSAPVLQGLANKGSNGSIGESIKVRVNHKTKTGSDSHPGLTFCHILVFFISHDENQGCPVLPLHNQHLSQNSEPNCTTCQLCDVGRLHISELVSGDFSKNSFGQE